MESARLNSASSASRAGLAKLIAAFGCGALSLCLIVALIVVATRGKSSSGPPTSPTPRPLATQFPARPSASSSLFMFSPAGSVVGRVNATAYPVAQAGIAQLLGFRGVVSGATTDAKVFYLSGTDRERAADVMRGFSEGFGGMIANRGGYGCARILDALDWDTIAKNPKILMGFSDLTALITAAHVKTGLVTFHGPMGTSTWGTSDQANFATRVLAKGELVTFANPPSFTGYNSTTVTGGSVEGKLIGGNLSVFVGLLGSPYLPASFKDYILFLEEVGEAPYRVDRMLEALRLAGIFDQIKGFVWGTCSGCLDGPPPIDPATTFSVDELIVQKFAKRGYPVWSGAMIGHIAQQFTLPIGTRVRLDATAQTITMLEKAVI
jgi:muramoyltetrapeptide carboxypeptidase